MQVGLEGGKDEPWGGDTQELVWVSVAELAHRHTSSGHFGGCEQFELRKIDS
jgi:hypothetical protein